MSETPSAITTAMDRLIGSGMKVREAEKALHSLMRDREDAKAKLLAAVTSHVNAQTKPAEVDVIP